MRWFLIAITALFTASTVPLPRADVSASVIIEARWVGHGSGIFISPTQVLTAEHVADMQGMVVRDVDGGLHHVLSIASSHDVDVAVLTVDHPFGGTVPKISCNTPERGDVLHYYGNPGGVEFVGPMYLHFIGGKGSDGFPSDIDLADGVIIGGASGSGVMNAQGSVIGLITIGVVDNINGQDTLSPTGMGGYVSFHYPEVCDFVNKEVKHKSEVKISDARRIIREYVDKMSIASMESTGVEFTDEQKSQMVDDILSRMEATHIYNFVD